MLHRYPNEIAQAAWTALFGFAVNLIVAAAVSLCTRARASDELTGLVYGQLPPGKRTKNGWLKRPETWAVAALLITIAVNIFFA